MTLDTMSCEMYGLTRTVVDMAVLECYHRELRQVEWMLKKQAKQHRPTYFYLLKTIPGIGRILALTILYEIGDIQRFESVQKFAS